MDRFDRTTAQRQGGVTLIELMVVLVIVAIISAIAYPSYIQFVVKSKRSAAQSALLQVADRQQQFYMDNKSYAATLVDLNFPANPFMIGEEGQILAADSSDRIYRVEIARSTATTYTLQAVPQLMQAQRDTDCGTLSLTHNGLTSASGSGDNCW